MCMKKIKKLSLVLVYICLFAFIPTSLINASEFSDNFDTNPYSGSWTNEMSSAVWDSTNGELDLNNDNDTAVRYSQSSPGSIEHEAQVTALMVTGERLVGPGVRFNNTGENSMYGMVLEGGVVNIYRWNSGARSHIASISSGVSSAPGNYYTMRMSASGGVGSSVVLNVWLSDHGSSKPSDPGWIGQDGSPNVTFTDSSASGTRLDGSLNSQTGIAGRASVTVNDNRHDYFKTRAISDRGGVVTPPSDTTPPTISSITVSNITTTGATITYTTSETSTSQVQYGPTTSYGSSISSVGTTLHTVSLSFLGSNSLYNFRISATDASGNNALSSNQTFTTSQVSVSPSPTADIQLNGSNSSQVVNSGTSLSLAWTSTNATGCTVTPGNFTGTAGTQTVTPSSNTTYTLTCSGDGGSAVDSIGVTVNAVVTPPATPTSGTPAPTGTGKYLYVSPTGNDSVTYANNNASNPWRTIGRATWGSTNRSAPNSAEAAKAGDVVLISGGTYDSTEVVSGRFGGVYNPVNQGTAGNYITFVCSGDCTLTAPNANSPIIGASGRSYIKWYANVSEGNSWVINACGMQSGCPNGTVNTTPDTGPVVCHDGTGCHIEGAVIDGTTPVDYTDNWNGVRVENAPSAVIRNNIIRNFRTQSGSRNASGVTLYGSANTIIENNQISNVAGGIYFKHNGGSSLPMTNVRARYNSISNAGQCASWSIGVGSNHFYQNICTDSSFGTLITGNGLLNDWIFNNTFYNISTGGIYLATSGTGGRFWNNICVNCASVISNEAGPMTAESVMDFEHNIYRNFSNFYSGVGGNQTFSAFKSTYPAFEQSAPASIDADPMFVSSTNFHLQSGSPARTLGVDILDLDRDGSTTDIIPAGVYVTGSEVIGLNTGGVVTPPPPPPSDTTPPTISSISVSNITTTGATITYTTNESATSQVQYGLTTSYGSTQSSGGTTSHSVTLSSLNSNTSYSYRISATDSAGNNALSANQTFTTGAVVVTPPVSTKFTIGQRVQTSANVNVRATANSSGTLLGTQTNGSLGTVVGGPTNSNSINWWNINYDNGVGGWSSEDFVQAYTAPTTPTTVPSGTPTPTGTTPTASTTPPTVSGGGSSPAPSSPSTPSTGSAAGGASAPSSGGVAPTTPTQSSTPTANIPKPTLTRTVYLGSKGSDVTSLQTFLISTGYLSPNLNTGYFGPATKEAVKKYQCTTLKLCSGSETTNCYGVVGAKTRATFTTTPTTTQTTTALSTEQRAVIQKQISDLLLLVQQLMAQLKTVQGN